MWNRKEIHSFISIVSCCRSAYRNSRFLSLVRFMDRGITVSLCWDLSPLIPLWPGWEGNEQDVGSWCFVKVPCCLPAVINSWFWGLWNPCCASSWVTDTVVPSWQAGTKGSVPSLQHDRAQGQKMGSVPLQGCCRQTLVSRKEFTAHLGISAAWKGGVVSGVQDLVSTFCGLWTSFLAGFIFLLHARVLHPQDEVFLIFVCILNYWRSGLLFRVWHCLSSPYKTC